MAEYIEREALQRNINEDIEACGEEDSVCRPVAYGSILGLKMAMAYANTLPAADVVEVRHGKWLPIEIEEEFYSCIDKRTVYKCYLCGRYEDKQEPYCNCGAKMDGKGDGE